jgi:hypothetical protein
MSAPERLNSKTFMPLRHKDIKLNINQKVPRFAWCLGAFVANYSPPPADADWVERISNNNILKGVNND